MYIFYIKRGLFLLSFFTNLFKASVPFYKTCIYFNTKRYLNFVLQGFAFFRVAVDAKEHKIFIPVLFIPIYFFRFFKQVVIHINTKRFFGIFAFAEDDVIGIICCDNINFCIFSVPPFADFCGSETEK